MPDYHYWLGETTPVTYKLFKDVFADLNAYYFTYFQDSDLFTFWYRNIFITDPLCWKKDKDKIVVKPDILVEFLLRLFFVLRDKALSTIKEYWHQKEEWGVAPRALQRFNDFVEILFKKGKTIEDWYGKAIEYILKLFSEIYGDVESVREEAMKMKDFLKEGKVYPYDTRNRRGNFSGFRYVQCLSHAYLTLLKEECLEGKPDGCVLLKRNNRGAPELDPKTDARILFDRRGGTFVPSPVVMQNYFKYRCAFVMSLWNMSAKEKYYYIKKFL